MKGFADVGGVLSPIAITTVAVMVASLTDSFEAIRVYEGTNYERNSDLGRSKAAGRNQMTEPLQRPEDASRRATANVQRLQFAQEIEPTPNMYKVRLTQGRYLQFLRYLVDIPPLRELTFCMWYKSSNLSHAQPLFSYAVQDKESLTSFWYEPKDSTIRMSIRDDLAFKIPAIVREGVWYHICLSWDGVQGRWIVFLNGSKIGSGQLHKYKGTYIPGGGEVVVGQETADFRRGPNEGIEGEIFGFNLVDESVKDEISAPKSKIAPDKPISTPYIPPFKALPPMKKSYQEIKAYVKSLPSDPGHLGRGAKKGPKTGPGYSVRKPPRKGKPSKVAPRPTRTKLRPRYKPPVRKAVVYERADRQLKPDEKALVKKMGEPAPVQANAETNGSKQTYNESYSVHSYRLPKETRRRETPQYEIYEFPEESEEGDGESDRRKVRQNFDLRTARKANGLYAASSRKPSHGRTTFHFETKSDEPKFQRGIRRSLAAEEKPATAKIPEKGKTPLDFIPVYEITEDDVLSSRKRRDADAMTSGRKVGEVGDLAADFRRLPHIPDGFIGLFAGTSTADAEHKPDHFFPNGTVADAPPPAADAEKLRFRNEIFDGPLPRTVRTMVVRLADLERRPGITSGSELVRRSYEECGSDRGSPVGDKDRLVVSWASTPVRIYGGAVVAAAENICGHF